MKRILLVCMMIALTGLFSAMNAQGRSGQSDKALSAQYKHEIDVLSSEIKTTKIKLKEDKQNAQLRSDLEGKEAQLKELKSKKKIVDDAINSQAASEKAAKRAENAAKKAEKAQQKADKNAANAQRLKESER